MKKTTANLTYLFFALTLSAGTQAFANSSELASGNSSSLTSNSSSYQSPQLSDYQFEARECRIINGEKRKSQTEFIKACTVAGLGSTLEICTERLDECSEGDSTSKYCLGDATSTADANKESEKQQNRINALEDKIESLNADADSLTEDAIDLVKRKNAAKAKFEETLIAIDDGKDEKLEESIDEMNEISNKIADAYNELNTLQFKMREFLLNRSIYCHEQASKVKAAYVSERKRRVLNGQKAHLTQQQLVSRTGLSVNAASVMRYNLEMRNCKAKKAKNGDLTPYGQQYALQRDIMANQKANIEREIKRLDYQKSIVKRQRAKEYQKLNNLEKAAFAAHSRALESIMAEELQIRDKSAKTQDSLIASTKQLDLENLKAGVSTHNVLVDIAMNIKSPTQKRNVASKSKIDAFATATSLLHQVEDIDRNYTNCNSMSEKLDDLKSTKAQTPANEAGLTVAP